MEFIPVDLDTGHRGALALLPPGVPHMQHNHKAGAHQRKISLDFTAPSTVISIRREGCLMEYSIQELASWPG